jgi:Spy/CpxP family protein refolding chaperone
MKRIIIPFLMIFGSSIFSAQQLSTTEFNAMTKEQKKETLAKMSSEDKKSFIRKVREDDMVKELLIEPSNEKKFRQILNDYQQSSRAIKKQFQPKGNFDQLTDAEAKTELDNSFVVGQQLMDNRKKYTNEFLKILSPKQVLQLFHSEMKWREKIEEHKDYKEHPKKK